MPENQYGSPDVQLGSSCVRVLQPAASDKHAEYGIRFRIPFGADQLECAGHLNTQGCLGKVTVHRLHAESYEDAIKQAETAVAGWLSHVSLLHELPIEIGTTHVAELSTGNQVLQFRTPQAEISFGAIGIPPTSSELALYASFYREALNSRSPIYQFLCFFKIIEGLEERRKRLDAPIVAKGGTPKRERSWLPSDPNEARSWLEQIYPGRTWTDEVLGSVFPPCVRGARVDKVIKAYLQPLRVRIAHAFLDSGEPGISLDEISRVARVEELIPITKFIARFLLRQEFPDYFEQQARLHDNIEFVPVRDLAPNDGLCEPPASGQFIPEGLVLIPSLCTYRCPISGAMPRPLRGCSPTQCGGPTSTLTRLRNACCVELNAKSPSKSGSGTLRSETPGG